MRVFRLMSEVAFLARALLVQQVDGLDVADVVIGVHEEEQVKLRELALAV